MIEYEVDYQLINTHDELKESVDLSDVRSVIAHANYHWRQAQILPYEYGLRIFKIGAIIASASVSVAADNMSHVLQMPIDTIKRSVKLARMLDCSEERFREEWDKHEVKSFAELCDIHLGKHKEKKLDAKVLKSRVYIRDVAKRRQDMTKDDVAEAKKMRDILLRAFPLNNEVIDKVYLRYYDCTGCGEMSPPKGHELVEFNGNPDILVPLCASCINAKISPEPDKVAEMYAVYAANAETALYKL